MSDEEKEEIKNLYTEYAKLGLKECKNMSQEEEYEYSKKKEKEIIDKLEKIKEKYSTQK